MSGIKIRIDCIVFRCGAPEEVKGQRMAEVDRKYFKCETTSSRHSSRSAVIAICVILAFVVAGISMNYYSIQECIMCLTNYCVIPRLCCRCFCGLQNARSTSASSSSKRVILALLQLQRHHQRARDVCDVITGRRPHLHYPPAVHTSLQVTSSTTTTSSSTLQL